MINHAMFQRNGRSGYVLKPLALRSPDKSLLNKQTRHHLDITVCINCPCPRILIDIDERTGDLGTTAPAPKRRKQSRDRRQASPEPIRRSLGALTGLGPLFISALEHVRAPSIESHEHGEE